jgi:hypothetical protein
VDVARAILPNCFQRKLERMMRKVQWEIARDFVRVVVVQITAKEFGDVEPSRNPFALHFPTKYLCPQRNHLGNDDVYVVVDVHDDDNANNACTCGYLIYEPCNVNIFIFDKC